MLVILDNGHGNQTSGKRSPKWTDGSQLFEYVFTRNVVEAIAAQLSLIGIDSHILVPERFDLSLKKRVIRANKIIARVKYCILLSIHGNGHGNENAKGFEVWTYPKCSDKSKELAQLIYNKADQYNIFKMRPDYRDGNPDKSARFKINSVNCPSILTESGFYTNEEECKYMMSITGQNEIAAIHTEAIKEYLKKIKK
jgi:N-acetylmuramoyl-L-alanine amidase